MRRSSIPATARPRSPKVRCATRERAPHHVPSETPPGGFFTAPGGLPAPNTNFEGTARPETGLIVKLNPSTSRWEDGLGRNWSPAVRFSLPDEDVFAIGAAATPPVQTNVFAGVGTVLFNMATNPVSGKVYVSNTDARNEVRFEGPGTFGGSTVRGHLHEARITVLDGAAVVPRHLNKHIDYGVVPSPAGVKEKSLAIPNGLAVSADGATLYVAAFGSSAIGVFSTAALEDGSFVPDAASHIAVSGGGPSGIVLDEVRHQLYVLTRFDDAISIIDTQTASEGPHVPLHNPEPASVVAGRPFLYDATITSSNGEASCASCHIFGDFDSLAWDLGNPDDVVRANPNPFRLGGPGTFHPMKGPMTTQSLRGLANHGPMHWRGDRTGGATGGDPLDESLAFKAFNVAFDGLLGRGGALTDAQMQAFTDFILQVTYPPNPIRALDNSLTEDERIGRNFFLNSDPSDSTFTCNGCHVLDPANGFFGTDGRSSFENEPQLAVTFFDGSMPEAAIQRRRQRQHGRSGARLRLPARWKRRHALPLPQRHRLQHDHAVRVPEPRRVPRRRGRRHPAPPGRAFHPRVRLESRTDRRPAGDARRVGSRRPGHRSDGRARGARRVRSNRQRSPGGPRARLVPPRRRPVPE